MNISYNALCRYLPKVADIDPHHLCDILTSIGLEVASIAEVEMVKGGLKGIVLGKVLTCEPHPNSDHLHLTTVDIGSEVLNIVCGAPNVASGQIVPVATIGAVLYNGEECFTIKKSKLRGEVSCGMICSEKELGIGEDTSGIMVLPKEAPIGVPAKEYFQIESDYRIEIDITPNRVDATSHYGVARDLAAYLSARGQLVKAHLPEVKPLPQGKKGEGIAVSVDLLPEECPRYSGITLKGIHNGESPDEIKNFLKAIDLHPVNLVVDISNIVLYEVGQPLHILDADKINGQCLSVCKLPKGTPFVTLDSVEHKLLGTEIMIVDGNKEPLCMAGVLGGKEAEVTTETKRIFIESANFNSTLIRKAARKHGISTDSSFRFERGLDPAATAYALNRAVDLLINYAGAVVEGELYDSSFLPLEEPRCTLSLSFMKQLLGVEIPLEKVKTILQSLDVVVEKEQGDTLHLLLPRYRTDVRRQADIVEEILRIYGYNEIPSSGYVTANLSARGIKDQDYHSELLISEQMVGAGYSEILCNSLSSEKYYKPLTSYPWERLVHLLNPLSEELAVLRQTLLFGGLEATSRNERNKSPFCLFFEWGNVYRTTPTQESTPAFNAGTPLLKGYEEVPILALWNSGTLGEDSWYQKEQPTSAFRLKGDVENIFRRVGIPLHTLKESLLTQSDLFTTELQFVTQDGKVLCRMGEVSSAIRKLCDIDRPVYYAELRSDLLFALGRKETLQVEDINKFPVVTRDFALLIDETVTFSEISKVATEAGGKLLRDVQLFDVYQGKNLPQGKVSYAVRFRLQDDKGTLTDKQIEKVMKNISSQLQSKLGATIR